MSLTPGWEGMAGSNASLLMMRPNKLECLYLARITFQSSLTEAYPRMSSERHSNWVGSGLTLKF
jgi:hypothetical protein